VFVAQTAFGQVEILDGKQGRPERTVPDCPEASGVLSGPLRVVGDVLPLKHVVILIQDPWLGLGWSVPDSLIVIAFLAVPAALTRRFLR
jgi:hypothetical protein